MIKTGHCTSKCIGATVTALKRQISLRYRTTLSIPILSEVMWKTGGSESLNAALLLLR